MKASRANLQSLTSANSMKQTSAMATQQVGATQEDINRVSAFHLQTNQVMLQIASHHLTQGRWNSKYNIC